MAGGTWIDQNKVRPGVYINYSSAPSTLASMGERGIVCIGKVLDWGEFGKPIVIEDPAECFEKLGYDQMSDEMIWLRQFLVGTNRTSGASKVLVWRLTTGGGAAATAVATKTVVAAKAKVVVDYGDSKVVTFTAKSTGTVGNNLAVLLKDQGSGIEYTLEIYQNDSLIQSKSGNSTAISANDYVDISGTLPGPSSISSELAVKHQLAGGVDAFSGSIGVVARCAGTRGNDITVIVTADPDNSSSSSKFYVQTLVSGQVVDNQTLKADSANVPLSGLVDNAWVEFQQKTGNAFACNLTLADGANGAITANAYSEFMTAMELETWNVLAYGEQDNVVKSSLKTYVERLCNDEGKKVQCVLSDYPAADSECVVSVYPQVFTDNSGHVFSREEMVCWVAGCTAGANVNESLTYASHPDAVSVTPALTATQQINALNAGQFVLFEEFGVIKNLQDNNTFTTYAVTKGKQFRKNRVIRTLFGICNDAYRTYSLYYIGNTDNDATGRGLLKAEMLNLLYRYQGNRALQNVVESDVVVSPGADSDSVLIELYIQPVDSIEKIYINITIS